MRSNSRDSFKAAVLTRHNRPLEIKQLKFPQLGRGQILVRVHYSTICASQIFEISGGRGNVEFLPHLLGHEGVGFVTEIGSEVTRFKSGDKVILTWVQQAGIECDQITHKTISDEYINAGKVTTFSEFTVVSENRLIMAPSEIDDSLLPLLGCSALTGAGMVMEHNIDLKRVLVVGAGGVGIFTILALLHRGVESIHIIEPSAEKRRIISTISQKLIVYESSEDNTFIQELSSHNYFREVFVCTSNLTALQGAISFVSAPGLLVFCTHSNHGDVLQIDPFDLIRGKVILGSWGGGCRNPLIREKVFELFSERAHLLSVLVSKPFPLNEVNKALELAKENTQIRILLRMNP